MLLGAARKQMFSGNGPGGEQNRVSRRGIIILAVGNEEKRVIDDKGPPESAIPLGVAGEKVKEQAAEPKRKAERIHHQDLLDGVGKRRVGDVLAGDSDVVHQFEKRPVMLDIPNQIGKENHKRDGASGKKPGRKQ